MQRQQGLQGGVLGHAQADGLALRVAHPARHFLGGLQDEGEGAGRGGLEQAVLAVVDAGVGGQLAQVAAQQGEVVLLVDAADLPQLIDRGLVVEVADQGVGRIGRHRCDTAAGEQGRRLLEEAGLGVIGVDFEELRHGPSISPAAHEV